MQAPLFADTAGDALSIGEGAWLLPGRALPQAEALLAALARANWRHDTVPGGGTMSVALWAMGEVGWVADARGYRYAEADPATGQPWVPLPAALRQLAAALATEAGYAGFEPDTCLINRYAPGARMGLHQDKDEADFAWPIVSLSFGMTATFRWGGTTRRAPVRRLPLAHGDALVFGGASRLAYHGVAPLAGSPHALLGAQRINFTLRRARG